MSGGPLVLRLTVRDVGTGTCRDVEVTAARDSRVGTLLDALPVPVRGRRCHVCAEELDPAARIVDPISTRRRIALPRCVILIGFPFSSAVQNG